MKKALSYCKSIAPCRAVDYLRVDSAGWKELVIAQQPVIIKGMCSHWPAVKSTHRGWRNFNYLMSSFGEYMVWMEYGGNYMSSAMKRHQVPLEMVLHYLQQRADDDKFEFVYVAQQNIDEVHGMMDDLIKPEITEISFDKKDGNSRGSTMYPTNLWLGVAGVNSPCHYDPYQNVLCQIVGTKSIHLFSPDTSSLLYPAIGTLQKNTSKIDFEHYDENMYPLFKNTEAISAELSAGDALFIPQKWWHYCKNETLGISVNFWWT